MEIREAGLKLVEGEMWEDVINIFFQEVKTNGFKAK